MPVASRPRESAVVTRGDDLELMGMVASADPASQRQVVERLLARVRRAALVLVRERADADDATQLSMLEILRSAGTYRGESSLERWADRIVARTSLRYLRELRLDAARRDDEADPDAIVASGDGRDAAEDAARPIEDYLARLSDARRTVFVLRHVLGHSIEEIADLTGVSPNTVKDRLLSGREQLRRMIRRDRVVGVTRKEER